MAQWDGSTSAPAIAGPAPQAPAARPPAGGQGQDFQSLLAYVRANGGQLPPGMKAAGGGATDVATGQAVPLPGSVPGNLFALLGGANPGGASAGGSTPPAASRPAGPPAPSMASAPGTMPPPLAAMPQLYSGDNLPANVQMRQLPNGMYVDQGQAGAAQQALGQGRLPDFNTYLQQQRMRNSVLPGAGDPQQILAQYMNLQKVQSQGDQDATQRMGTAGQLQLGQGQLALDQSKQLYAQDPQRLQEAGGLAAMQALLGRQGGYSPEDVNNAQRLQGRLVPTPAGPAGAQGAAAPGQPPPAGGAPAGPQQTPMEQLVGNDLAAKLASKDPEGKPLDARAKFNMIQGAHQNDPAWMRQNGPAVLQALAASDPNASDALRQSARASMPVEMLQGAALAPIHLLNANMWNGGQEIIPGWGNYYSGQGRQNAVQQAQMPTGEHFGHNPGVTSQYEAQNQLLRSLMP